MYQNTQTVLTIHLRFQSSEKMWLYISAIVFWGLFAQCYGEEDSCLARSLPGALITKSNMAIMKEHIRKTVNSVSFIQCGLRCVQKDWCISVNFESSQKTGICELSDYGVDGHSGELLSEKFEERKGFNYIQLRPLQVRKYS